MDRARQRAIQALKDAREELLSIKKDNLTYQDIGTWWIKWFPYFQRAENLTASGAPIIRGKYGKYVILSKYSVASGWVEHEVKTALAKERKEKSTVLFPVRVDKAVFESPFDWATEIRHERKRALPHIK